MTDLFSDLNYDPETGEFAWTISKPSRTKKPGRAGTIRKNGYVSLSIQGRQYYGHRLAWLYVYGEWPKGDIDHIDGNPSNNRISNLRDVSTAMNSQNQRRANAVNTTGFQGVWAPNAKNKGYVAYVNVNGVRHRAGSFATPEEAHSAYLKLKRELHPGCTI
jgi:hypothetical protein